MDRTPKGKSSRLVRTTSNTDNADNKCSTSTPVKESKKARMWENDIFRQESDMEVTWDWNSPKNIKPKILRVKKIELRKSPIVAPKKTSQIDHIKNFEKLREELQALRDEIARVDEDCLPLSPVDEQTFREESAKESNDIDSFIEEQYFHIENQERESCVKLECDLKVNSNDVTDLFNDSYDEQLILCTQMMENKLRKSNEQIQPVEDSISDINTDGLQCNINGTKHGVTPEQSKNNSRSIILETGNTNTNNNFENGINRNILFRSGDDSFDAVLKEFEDEDIDILTQTNHNTTKKIQATNDLNFKRTFSDANVHYVPRKNLMEGKKHTFPRAQSFESAAVCKKDDLPKHLIEEIERKRKEAQAKLKERKEKGKHQRTIITNDPYSNISSMKCSPDEIEQKRLQAKAIREAKQREIMERNRQEALKRLEMNRLKRNEKISLLKK